jgi:TPP-dependent pyruvate/acetoin dehydrogenase alpha subunit
MTQTNPTRSSITESSSTSAAQELGGSSLNGASLLGKLGYVVPAEDATTSLGACFPSTNAMVEHHFPVLGCNPQLPLPSEAEALHMYETMVSIRQWDERAIKLQRSGRIGFCVTSRFEEAAQTATAAALQPTDWIFPAYRQYGIMLHRGASMETLAHQYFGNGEDITKGRQMPCHPSDAAHYFCSVSSVIGSQIVHATGGALANQILNDGGISVTYFGDGASSANDFHSGLNLAAVQKAPALFICTNNQYAISLPISQQTASSTIAQKAVAYGMAGVRVDGTDALAVYQVTKAAADYARAGHGPVLIECLTYRFDPHSSSDDPSRYRDAAEQAQWEGKDPITRLKQSLLSQYGVEESVLTVMEERIRERIQQAIEVAQKTPNPEWESLITDVYETPPAYLEQQLADILDYERDLQLPHPGAFPL